MKILDRENEVIRVTMTPTELRIKVPTKFKKDSILLEKCKTIEREYLNRKVTKTYRGFFKHPGKSKIVLFNSAKDERIEINLV